MITRKNYCKSQLSMYLNEYNLKDPKDLVPHIFESSTMGIILQELGIINPKDYPMEDEYINSRGGIMTTYTEKTANGVAIQILTVREFLDLLPEKLDGEKSKTDQMFEDFKQNIPLK